MKVVFPEPAIPKQIIHVGFLSSGRDDGISTPELRGGEEDSAIIS